MNAQHDTPSNSKEAGQLTGAAIGLGLLVTGAIGAVAVVIAAAVTSL